MNWKLWSLGFLKVLWAVLLLFFLVMSGWLLHILEGASQSIIKSKKGFNKRAIGAGSVASLVAKPVHKHSKRGRGAIQGYLAGHYSYGKYIRKVV